MAGRGQGSAATAGARSRQNDGARGRGGRDSGGAANTGRSNEGGQQGRGRGAAASPATNSNDRGAEPAIGTSEVAFRGVLVEDPHFYGSDGKTPQLELRVQVETPLQGRDQPAKVVLSVTCWAAFAEQFGQGDQALQNGDVVEGRGRLGYNRPREEGDERVFMRISIDGEDGTELKLLVGDDCQQDDFVEVNLEGDSLGKFWEDKFDSGAKRVKGTVQTAVLAGGKARLADHLLFAWGPAADALWGRCKQQGTRVRVVGARLSVQPMDAGGQKLRPVVVADRADQVQIVA